uniref:Uncharacterized protein n=1 Tax=Mola mola TaxID=94237 RepID=A0A3Q3WJU8_MOLML
ISRETEKTTNNNESPKPPFLLNANVNGYLVSSPDLDSVVQSISILNNVL